jgi:hypothetical protein
MKTRPMRRNAGYAWTIDENLIDGFMGRLYDGPALASPSAVEGLAHGIGEVFRLLDGDDEVYFVGRLACQEGYEESGFEPLNDLGPDYGCTSIEYRLPSGRWESL